MHPYTERECKALVAFHAMSRNDYVSSFMRKSKKMWKMVVTDDDLLDFFCQLGVGELTKELHDKAEVFVCRMTNYGLKCFGPDYERTVRSQTYPLFLRAHRR